MIFSEAWRPPLDLGSANVVEDSEVEKDDQQEGDHRDEKDTKIPAGWGCSVQNMDDTDYGDNGEAGGKVRSKKKNRASKLELLCFWKVSIMGLEWGC